MEHDVHENFIISFPDDGSIKRDMADGITKVDFWSGIVTHPDGTTTKLNKRLRNSGQDFVRSVVIFGTAGMNVQLGNQGSKTFMEQCHWNTFENLG